jgi:hypothetical protein
MLRTAQRRAVWLVLKEQHYQGLWGKNVPRTSKTSWGECSLGAMPWDWRLLYV